MFVCKDLKIIRAKKTPNSIEVEIQGETHTIGNLLTEKLLQDSRCIFAAYKVEHPLEENVKIQITADKSIDVVSLLLEVLHGLKSELEETREEFEKQLKSYAMPYI